MTMSPEAQYTAFAILLSILCSLVSPVPFRQRVLLAVLLAEESRACQSNRTPKCGLDPVVGIGHVSRDHCQMDCSFGYP